MKKENPDVPDVEEDFSGPMGGSYFVLSEERDEKGRPMGFLTRTEARAQQKRAEEERWRAMEDADESIAEGFRAALERDDVDQQA